MCGFCGILAPRASALGADASQALAGRVERMVATIRHRGPDDAGVHVCGPAALGHARLSILDLSAAGHQPMLEGDGRLAIAYNGEVYNFAALRDELCAEGHAFRTGTDTEVVLAAYRVWGEDAFARLEGMYAFALWDASREVLFLVRDRMGIKPLYFAEANGALVFGSEIKALLASGLVARTPDEAALREYLWYGAILGEHSAFAGVRQVPPGGLLRVARDRAPEVRRYWRLEDVAPVTDAEPVAVAQVRALLERAVASHLVSDVPVGVFLSGGIDSSAITAFASRALGRRLATYSAGFDYDRGINELPRAARIAAHFGTEHHELRLSAPELPDVITRLVDAHDEPFGDAANLPLFLLCEALGGRAKVILQGDGGDELFAGYRRYAILNNLGVWRAAAAAGVPALRAMAGGPRRDRALRFLTAVGATDPAMRGALLLTVESPVAPPDEVLHPERRARMASADPFAAYRAAHQRFAAHDDVQRMLYTDLTVLLPGQFLPKVDRATMAHGVEVRVPFLDRALVEYAAGLPSSLKVRGAAKKYVLRRALRGVVPDEVLDGPKTGFGVPYEWWLQKPLAGFLREVLDDPATRQTGLFDHATLDVRVREHTTGARNHGFLLWKCLQLALWHRRYVDVA